MRYSGSGLFWRCVAVVDILPWLVKVVRANGSKKVYIVVSVGSMKSCPLLSEQRLYGKVY